MEANAVEGTSKKSRDLERLFRKPTDLPIEFVCPFYEKCILPKNDLLCNQFPDFMICPDYKERRKKY